MKTKIYSYQNFVSMLNMGLTNRLISSDVAIDLLCDAMPLTFHHGCFATHDKYGVVVVKNRLCAFDVDDDNKTVLRDLWSMLEGN